MDNKQSEYVALENKAMFSVEFFKHRINELENDSSNWDKNTPLMRSTIEINKILLTMAMSNEH